jgi:pimeloyl-ACP methyl ester carboxylesterase
METYLDSVEVFKENDPRVIVSKPVHKTALLCFNGFQNSDTHDATEMMDYFNKSFAKDYPDCVLVPVHLFYPADKASHHHKLFERRAREVIEEYIAKGYDLILMGYSFSGALACKLAKEYAAHIVKLILVAPVYDTILNGMIPHYIKYAWKFHKLSKKYGARAANAIGRKTTQGLFGLLCAILSSLVLNRHYFRKVSAPTLVIRGEDDLLCTQHSIRKVLHGLHKTPHLYYRYPGMTHGILKSIKANGIVYEDILHVSFATPFLLEKHAVDVEARKVSKIKYDEDGERIPTFTEIFSEIDPDADSETKQEQEGL